MTGACDVSVYLMTCARDCLDEPPLFGPRRMVEAAARLAATDPDDPALRRLVSQIDERRGALLGMDRDAFAAWLDELTGDLAGELMERELRRSDSDRAGSVSPTTAELLERFWLAYNDHDVETVRTLYAPDATHHEVAQGRHTQGAMEIATGLERFLQAFSDARWQTQRQIVSATSAAVSYRLTGHLSSPMGPFRTPGQTLDLEGMMMLECLDGQIVATADYWDAATFTRQMEEAA